jgi:amidophosphoribosyltransferase
MARDAGAKKVFLASAAPPVKFPNVYGIDMPSRNELIAFNKTEVEICKEIGADGVIYQNLDDLKSGISKENKVLTNFDSSCFDGKYVTNDISEDYLNMIESLRADSSSNQKPKNSITQLDLNLITSEDNGVDDVIEL